MPESETALIGESVPRIGSAPRAVALSAVADAGSREEKRGLGRGRMAVITGMVFLVSLAALVPTAGDFGVTWDEPAYRYSQVVSAQWWEQLVRIRSWHDVAEVFHPDTLLYYWQYGRFGVNFHPPLAGQLNLAAHALFGSWMKDIPARRMASVIEFAITITIGFQFMARRYGVGVGLVMAGSLLLMPRLYGQAHMVDTDTPGLLLWSAMALAFWKGLHEPNARGWRVAVGVLLGLAFVEKMAAVMVLLPLLLWLVTAYLPRTFTRPGGRFDWVDGVLTTGAMLVPLGLAFQQIQILQQRLPPPSTPDILFVYHPVSDWPGAILAAPLAVWVIRRLLGWFFPKSMVWGVERPALETWTAILAFAPVIGWLGNPAWWRETLPRLTHYYTLSVNREHSLPNIQIIYFGQTYDFSLPWHNAWVLMAITVPVAILAASVIGLIWAFGQIKRDRLPFYFIIHFLTFPVIRMFPTPAHDGVRLFLPTFFFLAAFAGWGTIWLADTVAHRFRFSAHYSRWVLSALVLGSAAFSLVRIHPYELSYYNTLIGGPRGAWERGFELSYWYDAFTDSAIADLNRELPANAEIDYLNNKTNTSVIVFQERQMLGSLRGDLTLVWRNQYAFPFVWLLTQDSKASCFTRLLFAMHPWHAIRPRQLDGAQAASVADPVAVSRAWALFILLDAADRSPKDRPAAPEWVTTYVPWLGRLGGDGLLKIHRLAINQPILEWSRSDPEGLLAAARKVAARKPVVNGEPAQRLLQLLPGDVTTRAPRPRQNFTEQLLDARAEALVEGVQILNSHRDEVVKVMTRYGYTDPQSIGGYLDRDLPTFVTTNAAK